MVKTFIFLSLRRPRTGKKHKIFEYSKLLAEKLFCRFKTFLLRIAGIQNSCCFFSFDRFAKIKTGARFIKK